MSGGRVWGWDLKRLPLKGRLWPYLGRAIIFYLGASPSCLVCQGAAAARDECSSFAWFPLPAISWSACNNDRSLPTQGKVPKDGGNGNVIQSLQGHFSGQHHPGVSFRSCLRIDGLSLSLSWRVPLADTLSGWIKENKAWECKLAWT